VAPTRPRPPRGAQPLRRVLPLSAKGIEIGAAQRAASREGAHGSPQRGQPWGPRAPISASEPEGAHAALVPSEMVRVSWRTHRRWEIAENSRARLEAPCSNWDSVHDAFRYADDAAVSLLVVIGTAVLVRSRRTPAVALDGAR
jgi:hypothetical protein